MQLRGGRLAGEGFSMIAARNGVWARAEKGRLTEVLLLMVVEDNR